jgi:hypothetical protein
LQGGGYRGWWLDGGGCLGASTDTNKDDGNSKKNETVFHRLISTGSRIII